MRNEMQALCLGDARIRLGSLQSDIAHALLRGEDCNLSLAPRVVEKARAALIGKRISTAAQAWPMLAQALGSSYAGLFTDYANEHPLPADASAISDGRQFAQWLGVGLPEESALSVVMFDLFHTERWGCMVRLIRLRHGFCAGFRIPGLFWRGFLVRYPRRKPNHKSGAPGRLRTQEAGRSQ
jgi:hypothetical protein